MKFKEASSRSLKSLFLFFENPFYSFASSLFIYCSFNFRRASIFSISEYPYFNYLADALLHGQLYLRVIPTNVYDLVFFNENYYLYWPPMPAIVLMPFVTFLGLRVSDFFFNSVIGALNVGIVALLFRELDKRQIITSTITQRGTVVILLAFGSVLFPIALGGTVWMTGQLIGFMFVALAYLFAVSFDSGLAFFVTGLMIAAAMLTRNNLLFMGLWPALFLIRSNWKANRKTFLRFIGLGLLPILISGMGFLAYNAARFGNPFDLGINYHNMNPIFRNDYKIYGPFNLHYVPINFYYQYIYYPFTKWPPTNEMFMGGSLFLLSPLFFAFFWGLFKEADRFSAWGLALSIFLTNIPIITLMGTGWFQLGPRYTLDFTLALLMLVLMGLKYWRVSITVTLLLISMGHYYILSLLKP